VPRPVQFAIREKVKVFSDFRRQASLNLSRWVASTRIKYILEEVLEQWYIKNFERKLKQLHCYNSKAARQIVPFAGRPTSVVHCKLPISEDEHHVLYQLIFLSKSVLFRNTAFERMKTWAVSTTYKVIRSYLFGHSSLNPLTPTLQDN
jgi:hypothetical protein